MKDGPSEGERPGGEPDGVMRYAMPNSGDIGMQSRNCAWATPVTEGPGAPAREAHARRCVGSPVSGELLIKRLLVCETDRRSRIARRSDADRRVETDG
jgi:hypothetical protein